jgi:hypothetical protein
MHILVTLEFCFNVPVDAHKVRSKNRFNPKQNKEQIMYKKRKYIKSGKFSKKNPVSNEHISFTKTQSLSATIKDPHMAEDHEKKAASWACKMSAKTVTSL